MQNQQLAAASEAARSTVRFVPRYSGRLDGAYLGGTRGLERMWIENGTAVATTLIAHHPYVEWRQRACRTHSWHSSPVVFAALRKVRVRIGARAMWSREPVRGVAVVVDLQTVPRPPPPPPPAWEWCETAEAYARRLLVRPYPRVSIRTMRDTSVLPNASLLRPALRCQESAANALLPWRHAADWRSMTSPTYWRLTGPSTTKSAHSIARSCCAGPARRLPGRKLRGERGRVRARPL